MINYDIGINSGYIFKRSGNIAIVKRVFRGVKFANVCGNGLGNKRKIYKFTKGSAQRMGSYLRSCVARYTHMVTLTYPKDYPSDGKIVKKHLHRMLEELRAKIGAYSNDRNAFSAFWFLEFQNRGAPHFHIFINKGVCKDWLSLKWFLICKTGLREHLLAGTKIEKLRSGRSGTIAYARKYAIKQEQKAVPKEYENVGRFWGVCGDRRCEVAATFVSDKKLEKCPGLEEIYNSTINMLVEFEKKGRAKTLHLNPGKAWVLLLEGDDTVARFDLKLFRMDVVMSLQHDMTLSRLEEHYSNDYKSYLFYDAEVT